MTVRKVSRDGQLFPGWRRGGKHITVVRTTGLDRWFSDLRPETQNHLRGLLKRGFLGPAPRVSVLVNVGWDPRISPSGRFPGYTDAVTFWEPLVFTRWNLSGGAENWRVSLPPGILKSRGLHGLDASLRLTQRGSAGARDPATAPALTPSMPTAAGALTPIEAWFGCSLQCLSTPLPTVLLT